jgi:hypothetical protein
MTETIEVMLNTKPSTMRLVSEHINEQGCSVSTYLTESGEYLVCVTPPGPIISVGVKP